MGVKEFAIQHAGQKIRFKTGLFMPNSRYHYALERRIVGYNESDSTLLISHPEGDSYTYPQKGDIIICKDRCFIRSNGSLLIVHGRIPDYELVPTQASVPYPHICKKCRQPARRCYNFTICSNMHCKSRREIKKILPPASLLGLSYTNPIRVICPQCNKLATTISSMPESYPNEEGACWRIGCTKRFPFTFKPGNWYTWDSSYYYACKFLGGDKWEDVLRT